MTGRVDSTVLALMCVVLAITATALPLRPRPRPRRSSPTAAGAPAGRALILGAWQLRRSRRHTPDARAVATWCDDIARRVRSGSTLRDALTTPPVDHVTERATAPLRLAIDRGASLGDAMARVDAEGPHLRLALGAISTASRIGGPAAASIDRIATLLRQRAADLDERAAQAAQARLSSHVMTAVPLLMLATLVVTDDDVRSVVASPIGTFCVGAGLALNAAGWWWMRRIVGVPS